MKKLKMLMCLLVIVFTLSACDSFGNETTTAAPETTATTSSIITSSAAEPARSITTALTVQTTETTVTTTSVTTIPSTTCIITTLPVTASATTVVTTTQAPATTTAKAVDTCSVTITCSTVSDNLDMLKKSKHDFVPSGGVILEKVQVKIKKGDTAFDALKRACSENVCADNCKYCQKNGVQLEYNYTPAFETYYIEGIHQIYEKDCGSMSGWMYSVNGEFPNVGSSSYNVKAGDEIIFAFTCDMGEDIGKLY